MILWHTEFVCLGHSKELKMHSHLTLVGMLRISIDIADVVSCKFSKDSSSSQRPVLLISSSGSQITTCPCDNISIVYFLYDGMKKWERQASCEKPLMFEVSLLNQAYFGTNYISPIDVRRDLYCFFALYNICTVVNKLDFNFKTRNKLAFCIFEYHL